MPQFLVAIQHPNEYQLPAGAEGEAIMRAIGALNREMMAAGVRDLPEACKALEKRERSVSRRTAKLL